MNIKYLTADLAEKTQYSRIRDAYDHNELSVVLYDSVWDSEGEHGIWCFEGKVTGEVRELVKKEMAELFPQYTYIYYSPYRKEQI